MAVAPFFIQIHIETVLQHYLVRTAFKVGHGSVSLIGVAHCDAVEKSSHECCGRMLRTVSGSRKEFFVIVVQLHTSAYVGSEVASVVHAEHCGMYCN